jgi:transcriptional regulator with XRE-family HTH domain
MPKKSSNPPDAFVGNRVRLRRMLIGMSQEKLGELLGLTFQQVQKYEKGVNRIGAGRLWQVAQILSVPINYFYEGAPLLGAAPAGRVDAPDTPDMLHPDVVKFAQLRERVPDKVMKSVMLTLSHIAGNEPE